MRPSSYVAMASADEEDHDHDHHDDDRNTILTPESSYTDDGDDVMSSVLVSSLCGGGGGAASASPNNNDNSYHRRQSSSGGGGEEQPSSSSYSSSWWQPASPRRTTTTTAATTTATSTQNQRQLSLNSRVETFPTTNTMTKGNANAENSAVLLEEEETRILMVNTSTVGVEAQVEMTEQAFAAAAGGKRGDGQKQDAEDQDQEEKGAGEDPTASSTGTGGATGEEDEHFYQRVTQPLVFLRCHQDKKTKEVHFATTKLRLVYRQQPIDSSPYGQDEVEEEGDEVRTLSRPYDLLRVERGQLSIVCKRPGDSAKRLVESSAAATRNSKKKKKTRMLQPHRVSSEVGCLGATWRIILKQILLTALDEINGLRLGRALQANLPFLTSYESYLLAQLIEALDSGRMVAGVLGQAFRNRNVSRVVLQALGPRFDFLYHWATAVTWNRPFDMLGQFPIVGALTRFPATENFPTTRNHALASIFRVVLGQGNWITRVLTGGREGLVTDDPDNLAQNLTAESNGFELANRNQYGTHFGRIATNKFRLEHRLPTDESLVRTFIAQPIPTMTNNGVVHMLRQLAKHWRNMLSQEYGNFAHQRMEQLDPIETLRFHIPEVLLTLSSLRGRNVWDSQVLGPVIRKLQRLRPGSGADKARRLLHRLRDTIVYKVCGGIATIAEPFHSWLAAIDNSLDLLVQEAKEVYREVSTVELGVRLGYDIMEQVCWKVPSDRTLKREIVRYILGKERPDAVIADLHVASALERTTPRDKRTLIELIQQDLGQTRPAKLLLGRVMTLLQREVRRFYLDEAILCLSKGDQVAPEDLVVGDWYWLEEDSQQESDLYSYQGFYDSKCETRKFLHITSGDSELLSVGQEWTGTFRSYIPVAEAICRAQKVFMTIELNNGKTFKYNAFMEFAPLRQALRRLIVVAQMACEKLDNARLNILGEIQRIQKDGQQMESQNLIVVGGGPAGMMTCLHCTENVLASGGVVKLFEARDAFSKGGSTYERAQIVRLDSRWIAMMRYHLGTGFEDVFVPASGETDSQLGNTLPSQGFVEITIKDLENLLHVEISRYWSRGVITVYTDARSIFDHNTNSLTKLGKNLKVGDVILHKRNRRGLPSQEDHPWKVVELIYTKLLGIDDLKVNEEYGVYDKREQVVLPFKLVGVDLTSKVYHFEPLLAGSNDLYVSANDLPSVYPPGTAMRAHGDVTKFIIECTEASNSNKHFRAELSMEEIQNERLTLHFPRSHIVEAIGKPSDSSVHLRVTTPEPYGVCCLEGLKVSLGMHNFGGRRWNIGIVDDIRSLNDQNTRIIGDFTKMVRTAPIVLGMNRTLLTDVDWTLHFTALVQDSRFPELNSIDPVVPKIMVACDWLARHSSRFRRQTLQTRFFEVGDNFYLGMEIPRELVRWKDDLVDQLVVKVVDQTRSESPVEALEKLKRAFSNSIDRLWYHACLETIREADVYNSGARRRVPKLYLISSATPTTLGGLPVGESFRLENSPEEKYEILSSSPFNVVARSKEGYVHSLSKSTNVFRDSNLTRSPDGNEESNVAISTFPVSHYVHHRSLRVADPDNGFVVAFTGDEQATPHFMRYSGLTGAAINAMSFNVFLQKAIEDAPFLDRYRAYAAETNWSNGEVVQRGTGGNYGEDGFLRPGFSYDEIIDYLYSKIMESQECCEDNQKLLSQDWKTKIAASLVPRGMDLNRDYALALMKRWQEAVYGKIVREVENHKSMESKSVLAAMEETKQAMDPAQTYSEEYWSLFLDDLPVKSDVKGVFREEFLPVADRLSMVCKEIIDHAGKASLYSKRISSELSNQPTPVDSVVDDFAVEAQSFANSLTLAAAFGAGALAFRLVGQQSFELVSAILGGLNILIAFSTMTNVARYKIRNEEARVVFKDEKFLRIKCEVFSLMDSRSRHAIPYETDPFVESIEKKVREFRKNAIYYELSDAHHFEEAFSSVKEDFYSPGELELFRKFLARKLLPDAYHENSYIQESLVEVYKAVEEMALYLSRPCHDARTSRMANALFMRLLEFESRLESSLQRGPVRWGFLKKRKFRHWDIAIVFRYLYSLLWVFPTCSLPFAPIERQTQSLLRMTRNLHKAGADNRLRRSIRDFETLYWATRESDIVSIIFVVATLTFLLSIIFTVARILNVSSLAEIAGLKKYLRVELLTDIAFYAAAASALGAVLAIFHLVRKLWILTRLWVRLTRSNPTRETEIRQVRMVTFIQWLLTLTRLAAAGGAAVALPFAVAEQGYTDFIQTPKDLPFWIALGAIIAAVGAGIFFFLVEYVVRYHLTTELGVFVGSVFKDEIRATYKEFSVPPLNSVDTRHIREQEAWEYTARDFLHRYRFDTVFAADRFGQILQFIQSAGLKHYSPKSSSRRQIEDERKFVTGV